MIREDIGLGVVRAASTSFTHIATFTPIAVSKQATAKNSVQPQAQPEPNVGPYPGGDGGVLPNEPSIVPEPDPGRDQPTPKPNETGILAKAWAWIKDNKTVSILGTAVLVVILFPKVRQILGISKKTKKQLA